SIQPPGGFARTIPHQGYLAGHLRGHPASALAGFDGTPARVSAPAATDHHCSRWRRHRGPFLNQFEWKGCAVLGRTSRRRLVFLLTIFCAWTTASGQQPASESSPAESRTITGRVVSESGQPLAGASVSA